MYFILCTLIIIYFLPAMIAVATRHPEWQQIALTNLFLGWSVMFWVVSFRHAVRLDTIKNENRDNK